VQNLNLNYHSTFDTWVQPSSGAPQYTGQRSAQKYLYRTQSGYFGPRSKERPLPPHDYFFRFDDITCRAAYDHVDNNGIHSWGGGPCLHPDDPRTLIIMPSFVDIDKELEFRLQSKLTEQVRGDLDVSVDLAEAGKTAKMLNVGRSVVDYTKGFFNKYGALKTVGNAWLEYTYGVKPLLSTIYGAAEENLRVVINKTEHVTARVAKTFKPDYVTIMTMWGPRDFPTTGSVKRAWSYGMDLRTDQHDWNRWSSLNPAAIAWELMPYSFVVDWFLNIGGYLRNAETYFLYSSRFRSGYRTILTACDLSWDLHVTSIPGFRSVNDSYTGNAKLRIIERMVLPQYPVYTFPSFRASLGSSRLLSTAALLAQQLEGRHGDKFSRYSEYLQKARKSGTRRYFNRRMNRG